MKHSESIAKLAAAFVAAQAEFQSVAKDAVNPFHKSKYATLDALVAEVRPKLAKHGLGFVQGTTTPESDANSKATSFTVETTLIHTSGEWWTTGVLIPLAKADPQGAGAAMTYGRRYSLASALGLVNDEDDDGNEASKQPKPAKPKPAPQATGPVMPIGDHKGQPLASLTIDVLRNALNWCKVPERAEKFATLITNLETELDARHD